MDSLLKVLKQYWGYDSFRPLQAEAMKCVLESKDSVVVLPTGGGKSLCFQAPAMVMDGMAVVVSPLIALMKDQVDDLRACGIPAGYFNSSLTTPERRAITEDVRAGRVKLLYVAPERLVAERFLEFLQATPVSFLAIDEAHCISMWGHDFRPDYRELRLLRDRFPTLGVHAFTATATHQVRQDIAEQLELKEPAMLVGSFDRPNLVYKLQRRDSGLAQVLDILGAHPHESGIIYCIRRAEVDGMSEELRRRGFKAVPYHAGMTDTARKANQEAFIREEAEIIVATIAFGMGIDKSNVRFVIHAGMPKSIEHYQQESGRAGRDGLEADCYLLFSGVDFMTWKHFIEKMEDAPAEAALLKLRQMHDFCTRTQCRHKTIAAYFGQKLAPGPCNTCDVCLQDFDREEDSERLAQAILRGILDLKEFYGAEYTAQFLLRGVTDPRITQRGHDKLPGYGALAAHPKSAVRGWIEQLAEQGFIQKEGEYNVLRMTAQGHALLAGTANATAQLLRSRERPQAKAPAEAAGGVDRDLFETLRALRRKIAAEKGVPPYIVFGDAVLRELARQRPTTEAAFQRVRGIGQYKTQVYAELFLEAIRDFCSANNVTMNLKDAEAAKPNSRPPSTLKRLSVTGKMSYQLFAQGRSIADVAEETHRARSTAEQYLIEYLKQDRITDFTPWVDAATAERIEQAALQVGTDRLRPIFDLLNEEVDYAQIRTVLTCLKNAVVESDPQE